MTGLVATTLMPMTTREVPLAGPDEVSLVARFARGEAGAFEEVVRLFQARVARLAHRLSGWSEDPDDVVQDVLLTALRKAGTFRGRASLWTWLATITINRCRRQARRRALFWRFLGTRAAAQAPAHPAADAAAIESEATDEVRSAVAALAAKDREVIVLFYLEQRTVAEMSELLGATPNALQVRLHRARTKLSAALSRFVDNDGGRGARS